MGLTARMRALLVALAVSVFALMPTAAFATSGSNNYSFYPTASAAAIYVDNMIAADKADDVQVSAVGEAAGAAGFVDVDVLDTTVAPEDGWKTYIQSAPSQNTVSYSYDAYQSAASAANGGASENVADYIIEYGRFGRLLSQLGLDNTGDSGIADPSRTLMGGLLQGTWYLANGADNAMGWCLNILRTVNPFRIIGSTLVGQGGDWTGNQATLNNQADEGSLEAWVTSNASDQISGTGAGGDESWLQGSEAFKTLMKFVTTIYNFCYNNAWMVIIPLFVVLLIWLLVMTNSRRHAWSLGKRVIMIVALVAFLIPAWGFGYTAVLDGMVGFYDDSQNVSPANRAVLSTLVDTAGWARTGYDTTDIGLKSQVDSATGLPTDQPSSDSVNNIRDITLAINALVADHEHDTATATYIDSIDDNTNNTMQVNGQNTGALTLSDSERSAGTGPTVDENASAAAQRLLTSYIEGDKYEAAQYESYVKGSDMDSGAFAEWLQATSNPENYYSGLSTLRGSSGSDTSSDTSGDADADKGLLMGKAPNRADIATSNEKLNELYEQLASLPTDATEEERQEIVDKILEMLEKEEDTSESNGDGPQGEGEQTVDGIQWFGTSATGGSTKETVPDGDLNVTNDGVWSGSLSAIGTYNFLNTRFDSNGFTVYSSLKSANTQSRVSHYATSLAGGSVLGILLGANAIILMLAFGITALVYGLSLLFNNVKRSLTLIVQTPFAMLGAMGSLARVLLIGMMMIVEIVCTVVLYTIMRSMLFVVNDFLISGIAGAIGSVIPATTALFAPLMVLISIAMLIFYIVLAIRLRGALTAAIDEAISNVLNRILGTQVQDKPSHALGKLAQGAVIGGALMGGAGGASGALMSGALVGAGASALAHTPDPMGRSEKINGDVIGDANASQSNVSNDSKSQSTTQGGDTANNNLDKTAGANTMFAGAHGIEGMARQAAPSLLTGNVNGSLAGVGEGTGLSETMRESNEDLGSANRLEQSAFGRDTYLDDDQLGDTTMRADGDVNAGDVTAGNVDASEENTTSLPGQRGIDGMDATEGMVGSESYVDASMAAMAAPMSADGDVPTFLGGDAYATSDALNGDQYMTGGVAGDQVAFGASGADAYAVNGDVNATTLGPASMRTPDPSVTGDVINEAGVGASSMSTMAADMSQTSMTMNGGSSSMDAYAQEYAGIGQGTGMGAGVTSAQPTVLGGGAGGGDYELGAEMRGVAGSYEAGDVSTMNVSSTAMSGMAEARRAAEMGADALVMPSADAGANIANERLTMRMATPSDRSLGGSTSFGSLGLMGSETNVDASMHEGARMSQLGFDQSRHDQFTTQATQMQPGMQPGGVPGQGGHQGEPGRAPLGSRDLTSPYGRSGGRGFAHERSLGSDMPQGASGAGSVFSLDDVGMHPASGAGSAGMSAGSAPGARGSDEMRPRQS